MRSCVLIFLLTCSQKVRVIALPTGNATGLFPTQAPTKAVTTNSRRNTTIIQHSPTTTVQETIPGTKGVSGCSVYQLEDLEFLMPIRLIRKLKLK